MRLAYVLARRSLPKYSSRYSRKDYTLHQLFACLVIKEQIKLSYRKLEAFLNECPEWCDEIGLRTVPDHNTLCRAAAILLKGRTANRVLDLQVQWAMQAKLLSLSTHPVALDSTSYESHHVSRHYEKRCHETRKRMRAKDREKGRSRTRSQTVRNLPKLAIAVASFAHFVISFWTGTGAGADHPHFRPVLQDARDRVGRKFKVAADAGYDSEAAHVWAREEMGLTSIIPPIHGRPRKDGGPPGGRWRRRMKGILATKGSRRRSGYTQRWQVETTNSMMKRNLSSALAGRTAWSRKRDMTLKVLVHNLMLLRRRGLRQSTDAPFRCSCFPVVLSSGPVREAPRPGKAGQDSIEPVRGFALCGATASALHRGCGYMLPPDVLVEACHSARDGARTRLADGRGLATRWELRVLLRGLCGFAVLLGRIRCVAPPGLGSVRGASFPWLTPWAKGNVAPAGADGHGESRQDAIAGGTAGGERGAVRLPVTGPGIDSLRR